MRPGQRRHRARRRDPPARSRGPRRGPRRGARHRPRPRGGRAGGAAGGGGGRRAHRREHPLLRAQRRRRPPGGLQGVLQGDHGRRRCTDRRLHRGENARGGDGGDHALPGGDQGRRPGRRQGCDHRGQRGRGARRPRGPAHRAPVRHHPGGGGGAPGWRGAVTAGGVRRRHRGAAGLRPGLQADLQRRSGPQHRRDGLLLAGAGRGRDAGPRDLRRRPPAGARRDGQAGLRRFTASCTPAS